MQMTKNPLALAAGAGLMIFGIAMASFFGYYFFIEEKVFKRYARQVVCTLDKKEKRDIRHVIYGDEAFLKKKKKKNKAAEASVKSAASTTATSATTDEAPVIKTEYYFHYSFTPVNATRAVTGTYRATKRLFSKMNDGDKVALWYNPDDPKGDNRPEFPVKFGSSFYAGISALLGGCLFVAYLGWCFIFPEDEPEVEPARIRKKEKRKKGKK